MKSKKLLRLNLFTLCDYANISQDGKLSVIGIFNRIFINQLPAQHPRMYVVAVVDGMPNLERTLKLVILDPLGQEKIKQELKVAMGPNGTVNLIAELGNLPLPVTGEYTIVLKDNEVLGKLKFSVFRATQNNVQPKKEGVLN